MIEDVAAYREKLGMNKTEFSEKIGVSIDTLRKWENGGARPKWFNLVMKGLDCELYHKDDGF